MRIGLFDVALGFVLGYFVAPWAIRVVQNRRAGG